VERGKKSVKKKELRATALSLKEAKKGISNKFSVDGSTDFFPFFRVHFFL